MESMNACDKMFKAHSCCLFGDYINYNKIIQNCCCLT